MEPIWTCPVCGQPLDTGQNPARCPQGHSYDRARSGYWNLLPPGGRHSRQPGDNKQMIAARQQFLDQGYYQPLVRLAARLALDSPKPPAAVLDAGCGEGYYSRVLFQQAQSAGRDLLVAGVDISKFGVDKAARRLPQGQWAVASLYHLPVLPGRFDLIYNLFAPHSPQQFARALAPGGRLLIAVPGPRHLWELKQFLYETPYPNPDERLELPGFELLDRQRLTYTMELDNPALNQLFQMTPYCYKTPPQAKERLAQCAALTIAADFIVVVGAVRPEAGGQVLCCM